MHKLLDAIEQELNGVRIAKPVTIAGHKYGLVILNSAEETLAKALIPDDMSLLQAMVDTSTQTLAVSLRSIDDVPVEQLFLVGDDMPKPERDAALNNEKKWRCGEVAKWLATKPGPFTRALYTHYMGLQGEAKTQLDELKSF